MAFLDNTPNPAPISDAGFKISKPNYNAATTSPQNLLFSSSWPSIAIAFSLNLPNTSGYPLIGGFAAIKHYLGYPPLAFFWGNASNSTGSATPTNVYSRNFCNVDSTYIYLNQSPSSPVSIAAYAIDLSQDIDYTTYPGSDFTSPYDKNYGIKVVKQGKDINSKDMQDFILHSRCQTPLIQAVKTEETANPANPTVIQYTNKVNYPTWTYGFVRQLKSGNPPYTNPGFYEFAPYWNQAFPKMTTNGVTSTINITSESNGATIVVLRDPMFAATSVTEQY